MRSSKALRRSPSLPCSPQIKSDHSMLPNLPPRRKSPRRRTSLETIPLRSPPHCQASRFQRRRISSNNFGETMSASSIGSNDSSSGLSPTRLSPLSLPAGDSDDIPKGSMRKRGQIRGSSNITLRKTTRSSISFRRKRRRNCFRRIWRSPKSTRRFVVILSMLFILSFSMAFLSKRQPPPSSSEPSASEKLSGSRTAQKLQQHIGQTIATANATQSRTNQFVSLKAISDNARLRGRRKDASIEEGKQPPRSPALPLHFGLVSEGAPSCSPLNSEEIDFTVVTQMSTTRLWMMEHHCLRWKRAFSIAVHIPPSDSTTTVDSLHEQLEEMGCNVERVEISIVAGYSEEEYPVNVLRNRALEMVHTSHVVYVDVDFWESTDLYETLQNHLEILANDPKQAFVIPAFQLNRQCKEWRECPEKNIPKMPIDKESLLDLMVEKRQANAFDPTNQGGHGSTLYREWLEQDAYSIVPIKCVKSNRYEPYLVFRYCHDLPPFQEAFTGYGKNKMTWVMQLRRAGYKLGQLGQSFVVHYPHLDSKARMHWNGGSKGQQLRGRPDKSALLDFKRGQVDQTFMEFREWMENAVPDETVVGKCKNALDDDQKLWVAK